jgi:hypothetical protein
MFFSLLTLGVASLAGFFFLNVQEDAVKVGLGCLAVTCVLITLFCAPWSLKLVLAAIPFIAEWVYRPSL